MIGCRRLVTLLTRKALHSNAPSAPQFRMIICSPFANDSICPCPFMPLSGLPLHAHSSAAIVWVKPQSNRQLHSTHYIMPPARLQPLFGPYTMAPSRHPSTYHGQRLLSTTVPLSSSSLVLTICAQLQPYTTTSKLIVIHRPPSPFSDSVQKMVHGPTCSETPSCHSSLEFGSLPH